jgi:beta-lactamase class A
MSKLLLFVWLISLNFTFGQAKHDKKLQSKIELASKGFNGTVGVYVQNVKTGRWAGINADSLFPTASMIKVPIMLGVFDLIERKILTYDQELLYRDTLKYDNGLVGSLKDSTVITLSETIFLMEALSDNTASLWLQGLAKGENINALLASNGFKDISVNSRTPQREDFRKKYGWGVCSPQEMVKLFGKLYMGDLISKSASERMLRTLGNQFWDTEGLAMLPKNIRFASKTGAVDKSRSEVTLVYGPKSEYIYCIVTKNQSDISYLSNNEGFELIRKLSKIFWEHYN